MFVDVLRRYLLIVWNFFFGQVSTESIKAGPPSCPEDKPAVSTEVVPPVDVDDSDVKIENKDDEDNDIIEIFDDEEEDEEDDEEGEELILDDEDEIEEDLDEKAVAPKKPEDKVVANDTPTKPSVPADKTEEVKAPVEQPKPKDEIKKPEPPKAPEQISEKPKIDVDNAKKSEIPAKPKPEFETGEREGVPPAKAAAAPEKDASKFKSEFEIVEREDRDALPPKPKSEFEVVERGTAVKPVQPPPPPPPSSTTATGAVVKDEPSRPSVKAGGDDKGMPKPVAPEKVGAHVKFQDDDETTGKGPAPVTDFATLEKGETVVKPPGGATVTGDAVGDFLSAEQAHGGQLLKSHHESIQDQQLDYSDSGEELSDDDIEIDYEDDEDDEEVVEVKPLPPVARSVYKKND